MRFKVGDKVRVKVFKKRPLSWNECGRMDHMMGNEYEIRNVNKHLEIYYIYDEKEKRTWTFGKNELEPAKKELEPAKKECIVIYRKGSETIALNKATGEKAVAKCSPDDTYDFNTGAKLAFDRLVKPPVKEVREVKRVANMGEYVKIVKVEIDSNRDYKVGDILFILSTGFLACDKVVRYGTGLGQYLYESEYVVLENYQPPKKEKPAFKPHLKHKYSGYYGNIGDETPFRDAIGRALRVGDTVDLYDKYNNYIGEKPIVMGCFSEPIVMGIGLNCSKDGTIEDFKIILKRRYEEVANGEYVGDIKYIKEEV